MPSLASMVGLTVAKQAKILFVLDKPGEFAARHGQPKIDSGWSTLARYLRQAGISEEDYEVTYMWPWVDDEGGRKKVDPIIRGKTKVQWQADDVLWKGARIKNGWKDAMERLETDIAQCAPTVIVPLGNIALFGIAQRMSVAKWRGSALRWNDQIDVIPTYSGEAINRQWDLWPQVVRDLKRVVDTVRAGGVIEPNYKFIIRPNYSETLSILNQFLVKAGKSRYKLRFAVDVETRAGQIACVGFAWSKTEAICIPYMCMEKPEGYWTLDQEVNITWALRALLTHPNVETVGQNFIYDAQYFLRNFKYCPNHCYDTMLAQHCLYLGMPKGLDYLSSMYCEYHYYWKDESKNWDPELGEDQLWVYNCKDAVVTYEAADALHLLSRAKGLEAQVAFQQSMFWPVLAAMLKGVHVDHKLRDEISKDLVERQMEASQWLHEVIGQDINLASPTQLATLFYEDLNQPPILKKGTGRPTTDGDALEKIGTREPLLLPVTETISYLRSLSVLYQTFIVGAGLDKDGRMRCSYNVAGTVTLRLSSSENAFGSGTNLQNVTTGDEIGPRPLPNLRRMFTPDRGKVLWDLDGDSADLRIVTAEANEPELVAWFAEGKKPYVELAKEFYHDQSITKAHPSYKMFKAFAHATNYVGTPSGIAPRIGMQVRDVERMQNWYFDRFPRIKLWQDSLKEQIANKKKVRNVYGYHFELFDRPHHNTINECAAWIPQSTIAIWINKVWVRIFANCSWVEILLQTHDSITGQFDRHLGEDAINRLKAEADKEMLPYGNPMAIPVGIKTSEVSWGDCG